MKYFMIVFLFYIEAIFLIEAVCCDSSTELSQRDSSDEGSQHMFLDRINKVIPNYHQILPLI